MPSLKEVRNKIVSVGSTMQITSAMKMVSAAKLKRAQDAIVQMRPYANKLKEILENVSGSVDASDNVYARNSNVRRVLIVAVSSNRGLAGAFNSNIIKKTNSLIQNDYSGMEVTILPVSCLTD
jgi:F-type H+-transporting ATPase subunit gamma